MAVWALTDCGGLNMIIWYVCPMGYCRRQTGVPEGALNTPLDTNGSISPCSIQWNDV
jgi:hypothetical protein